MGKKKIKQENKNICDTCFYSKWIETHQMKDLNGKPICLKCKYRKYAIIRGNKACEKWTKK